MTFLAADITLKIACGKDCAIWRHPPPRPLTQWPGNAYRAGKTIAAARKRTGNAHSDRIVVQGKRLPQHRGTAGAYTRRGGRRLRGDRAGLRETGMALMKRRIAGLRQECADAAQRKHAVRTAECGGGIGVQTE